MAETRLADIIEPAVYLEYMQYELPELNAFVQSGVMVPPPANVQTQMNAGGSVIDMPKWDDLVRGDPDIMSDDPGVDATLDKVGTRPEKAIKHYWHKGWSSMDLAGFVATGTAKDPIKVALNRFGEWWTQAEQRALLASCQGVRADNEANNGGDMVHSVYNDVASPTAANLISYQAFTAARMTAGDHNSMFTTVAMHSKVYGDALNEDQIDFIPDSEQKGEIPTYHGLRVIQDDDMTTVAGTNSPAYTTIMFGEGAFTRATAAMEADEALERDRKPEKGNGGGQTNLHTRMIPLIHPRGVSFGSASVAGKSPTMAELANAANWTRIYERKSIRLAFLITN